MVCRKLSECWERKFFAGVFIRKWLVFVLLCGLYRQYHICAQRFFDDIILKQKMINALSMRLFYVQTVQGKGNRHLIRLRPTVLTIPTIVVQVNRTQ
jgi:hypothetical protein